MATRHFVMMGIVIMSFVQGSWGGGTFGLKLETFSNPSGRELSGSCCELTGCGSCDHVLLICLDTYDGTQLSNMFSCRKYHGSTGRLPNTLYNTFNGDSDQFENPIYLKYITWPEKIVLKVYARDYDSWRIVNNYADVDTISQILNPPVYTTYAEARWKRQVIQGKRFSSPTSLVVHSMVWCDAGFYGPHCNKYCVGQDGNLGHYTCNSRTGDKICLPGWEEPSANCNIRSDDCAGGPCTRGVCIDRIREWTCKCPNGYEGLRCERDVPECDATPCNGNNTLQCIEKSGTYICQCKHGYVGSLCQFHLCDDNLGCQNKGVCVGHGECHCKVGFTGQYCQHNICHTKICHSGGKCELGHCYCASGYHGEFCEEVIDRCAGVVCSDGICIDGICKNACRKRPCQNEGTCYFNALNRFVCDCLGGYTGHTCETEIEIEPVPEVNVTANCKPVVCINNGICSNGACLCTHGFSGKNCEVTVDNCSPNPCLHNATCYSGINSLFCSCPVRFTGKLCEIVVKDSDCNQYTCINGECNEGVCGCTTGWSGSSCNVSVGCQPSPCQNGGTCYRNEYSYICNCAGHWTGMHCTEGEVTTIPPIIGVDTTWIYIVLTVVLVAVIVITVVVVLLMRRKSKKKKNKDVAVGVKSAPPVPPSANVNTVYNRDGVYENVDDEENVYQYATQNDINLNIVPRNNVYSKELPMGKKPLAERSVSYSGYSSQGDAAAAASTSDKKATGYTYAKIAGKDRKNSASGEKTKTSGSVKEDKNSTYGKTKELKTPKHLADRYEAMKVATLRNDLKGDLHI